MAYVMPFIMKINRAAGFLVYILTFRNICVERRGWLILQNKLWGSIKTSTADPYS